jgi:hypothetical protein
MVDAAATPTPSGFNWLVKRADFPQGLIKQMLASSKGIVDTLSEGPVRRIAPQVPDTIPEGAQHLGIVGRGNAYGAIR